MTTLERKRKPAQRIWGNRTWKKGLSRQGREWDPSTRGESYLRKIIHALENGDRSYTELKAGVGVCDNILTNALDWLMNKEQAVRRVKKRVGGKRDNYSLNKDSPYVKQILKRKIATDPKVTYLDAKGFIKSGQNLMNLVFSKALGDLILGRKGKNPKKLEAVKQSAVLDFVDVIDFYSHLVQNLQLKKRQEIQTELQAQAKKQWKRKTKN